MRELQLTNSDKTAIVDAKYYDYLNQWNWRLDANGYVVRSALLHREVMHLAGHVDFGILDHRNRNPLDNQEKNIRPATPSQNNQNHGISSSNTTGYIGVQRNRERVFATVHAFCRDINLGMFDDTAQGRIAAGKSADVGRLYYHDADFVVLNFKRSDYPDGHPDTWPPGPYSDVIYRCRQRPEQCSNMSGYWNVGWSTQNDYWQPRARFKGKSFYFGYAFFKDSPNTHTALLRAVKVADIAAIYLGRAKINLGRDHYPAGPPRDWPEESIPDCPALRRLIEA